jgi:lysophospholipase L1-like esterase
LLPGCQRPREEEASPRASVAPSSNVAAPSGAAASRSAATTPSVALSASAATSPPRPLRYPLGSVHSPLTREVVTHLQSVRARDPSLSESSFLKIGDSITASGDSLRCLGDRLHPPVAGTELGAAQRAFAPEAFRRVSHAARVGWSVRAAARDGFSALEREAKEVRARFALVQFGTNDVEDQAPHVFGRELLRITDWLLERGIIPLLVTPPPRRYGRDAARWMPRYRLIVRAIAEARRVPLVDYFVAVRELPRAGLAKDGIHPGTYREHGRPLPCAFSPRALEFGYNRRNLIVLEGLARVRAAVVEGRALDPDSAVAPAPAELTGNSAVVEDWPASFSLAHLDVPARVATPTACERALAGEEGGVRFSLGASSLLFAVAFGSADAELALLTPNQRCRAAPFWLEQGVPPGEFRLSVIPGRERRGELFLLLDKTP